MSVSMQRGWGPREDNLFPEFLHGHAQDGLHRQRPVAVEGCYGPQAGPWILAFNGAMNLVHDITHGTTNTESNSPLSLSASLA